MRQRISNKRLFSILLPICLVLIVGAVLLENALQSDFEKITKKLAPACRAGDAAACSRIVEIARTASSSYDRSTAVKNIADQRLLAEIADADQDAGVRSAAVGQLTDSTTLTHLAKTGKYSDVRGMAVGQLTDRMVLDEIAKTDSDLEVRFAAVCQATADFDFGWSKADTPSKSSHRPALVLEKTVDPRYHYGWTVEHSDTPGFWPRYGSKEWLPPSPVRTLVCILKKKNSSTGSYRDQHNQPVEVESEVWRVTVLGLPERSVHACKELQPDFPDRITSKYLTARGPAWEWLRSVVAAE